MVRRHSYESVHLREEKKYYLLNIKTFSTLKQSKRRKKVRERCKVNADGDE